MSEVKEVSDGITSHSPMALAWGRKGMGHGVGSMEHGAESMGHGAWSMDQGAWGREQGAGEFVGCPVWINLATQPLVFTFRRLEGL
ncbi:MAG TPA: hypothetical protein PKY06_22545 [Saprospiraceae bacterium]|nr:hypothetical protein [Saprospiraceae bacterium]